MSLGADAPRPTFAMLTSTHICVKATLQQPVSDSTHICTPKNGTPEANMRRSQATVK
jgi:hypothetical protein